MRCNAFIKFKYPWQNPIATYFGLSPQGQQNFQCVEMGFDVRRQQTIQLTTT